MVGVDAGLLGHAYTRVKNTVARGAALVERAGLRAAIRVPFAVEAPGRRRASVANPSPRR